MLQNMTEYNNNGIRIQSAVLPQPGYVTEEAVALHSRP